MIDIHGDLHFCTQEGQDGITYKMLFRLVREILLQRSQRRASSTIREIQLLTEVLLASSRDRHQEAAKNVLTPSTCSSGVKEDQMRCQCNGGEGACYWSSVASRRSENLDWICFKLISTACIVTSLKVQPYEAWWQPEDTTVSPSRKPVYSPKQIRFRFGYFPNSDPHVNQRSPEEVAANSCAMNAEHEDGNLIHFCTEKMSVPQTLEGLQVELARPILVLGGFASLQMFDRVQRQTMSPRDFYTCIQHAALIGYPLYGIGCRPSSTRRWGHEDRSSWEMVRAKSCAYCGSFVEGPPSFSCNKLLRCSQCRQVWYCGSDHQKQHYKFHKMYCAK